MIIHPSVLKQACELKIGDIDFRFPFYSMSRNDFYIQRFMRCKRCGTITNVSLSCSHLESIRNEETGKPIEEFDIRIPCKKCSGETYDIDDEMIMVVEQFEKLGYKVKECSSGHPFTFYGEVENKMYILFNVEDFMDKVNLLALSNTLKDFEYTFNPKSGVIISCCYGENYDSYSDKMTKSEYAIEMKRRKGEIIKVILSRLNEEIEDKNDEEIEWSGPDWNVMSVPCSVGLGSKLPLQE